MTTKELDDLRIKAEAVNGGKWTHAYSEIVPSGVIKDSSGYLFSVLAQRHVKDLGDYIAAANPEVVTRLLYYVAELERALHDLQQDKGVVIESARQQGRDDVLELLEADGQVRSARACRELFLPNRTPFSIMELREEVRKASKPLYIVTASYDYQGDMYVGSYDTLAEARAVAGDKNRHWDSVRIECVQCGEWVPVPEDKE
jgi:hypothetical protein